MSIGGSHKPTNFPYLTCSESGGELVASPGGQVLSLLANATTLLIGDAVYLQGTGGVVDKSATLSAYTARIGIVVGGSSTNRNVLQTNTSSGLGTDVPDSQVGTTAALAGKKVIVMYDGICYVQTDGAVTAGAALTASTTTAGQVSASAAVTGKILGVALDTVGAAGIIRMLVNLN